jgi:hypothetical protein
MIVALVLGTLLALAALAFVLHPLFVPPRDGAARRAPAGPVVAGGDDAVDVLREIEFDRETGKLSDHDYATLKATYTERALAELRAGDAAAAAGAPSPVAAPIEGEDAAEAAIRRVRASLRECASCGPRPEPDALYCSSCGRYLPGACARCGATASEPGARFCNGCGDALAAA